MAKLLHINEKIARLERQFYGFEFPEIMVNPKDKISSDYYILPNGELWFTNGDMKKYNVFQYTSPWPSWQKCHTLGFDTLDEAKVKYVRMFETKPMSCNYVCIAELVNHHEVKYNERYLNMIPTLKGLHKKTDGEVGLLYSMYFDKEYDLKEPLKLEITKNLADYIVKNTHTTFFTDCVSCKTHKGAMYGFALTRYLGKYYILGVLEDKVCKAFENEPGWIPTIKSVRAKPNDDFMAVLLPDLARSIYNINTQDIQPGELVKFVRPVSNRIDVKVPSSTDEVFVNNISLTKLIERNNSLSKENEELRKYHIMFNELDKKHDNVLLENTVLRHGRDILTQIKNELEKDNENKSTKIANLLKLKTHLQGVIKEKNDMIFSQKKILELNYEIINNLRGL